MFAATLEALAEAHRDLGANRESINTMRAEKNGAELIAGDRLNKLMKIEREAGPRQKRYEDLWTKAEELVRIVEAMTTAAAGAPGSRELYEPALTSLRAAVNASETDASGVPF
ncbi:MAG TPA: hypothetical protein VIU44_05315 [Gaiellaceae bacterium]